MTPPPDDGPAAVWALIDNHDEAFAYVFRSFEQARERAREIVSEQAERRSDDDEGEPPLAEMLEAIDAWKPEQESDLSEPPRELTYARRPRGSYGPWFLTLVQTEIES